MDEDYLTQRGVTVRVGIGEIFSMVDLPGHSYSPDLMDDIRVNIARMLEDALRKSLEFGVELIEEEESVEIEDGQEVTGRDG